MEFVTYGRTGRRHRYHWSYPYSLAEHWVKNRRGLHTTNGGGFMWQITCGEMVSWEGATVTSVDSNRWDILHFAARSGDPDTVDLILTHLPDIESKTADGETPLIIAVCHGKLQSVKYLLERGANPLAKDNRGQDSLYHASLRDSDVLDLLPSHVANSESTTGND